MMFRKKAGKLIPTIPLLPILPLDITQWIQTARPIVEGKQRLFTPFPFWNDIYADTCNRIFVLASRQSHKSTWFADILAHKATTLPKSVQIYVTHDDESRSGFSNQKFRIGTLEQNPLLKSFVKGGGIGKISEIEFLNGSRIYLTTDNNGYGHVEGKSPSEILLDEFQYHDLEFLPKLFESMSSTKGKLKMAGIGGEGGSEEERLWLDTDQREWVYDDPDWRDLLQFDSSGLKIGDYLVDVLKGRWTPNGTNDLFHGYHLSQIHIPTIPLTISDAIKKYKVDPIYSIEWKQNNYPNSIYQTHVLGSFYKAKRRPVTREMVLACMEPYRNYDFLSPEKIYSLKEKHEDKIKVSMGVDFGSSVSTSSTVITILVGFTISEKLPKKYRLAFIEKRPAEKQMMQAIYICNLFKKYHCDVGVGDLGYGTNQIKAIQDGSYDDVGTFHEGVTSNVFVGCRTTSNETKPVVIHDSKTDEHGEETSAITIDKTSKIQEFIDMLETKIQKTDDSNDTTQFVIPYKYEDKVNWLIKEFTSITRKDLAKVEGVRIIDSRQRAKKEFNHPADAIMAIIYAKQAQELDRKWNWFSA
jgi:hypothetical protein